MVLLSKGRKPPDEPLSYRSVCMFNTAEKILERIIHGRIEKITDRQLSDKQFSFRKGRSTLDTIDLVVKTMEEATSSKRWKGGEKEYCLVVSLDIKNAFNLRYGIPSWRHWKG